MEIFKQACKVYLFKKKKQVTVSFRVSDVLVHTYIFPVDHFEKMINDTTNDKEFEQTVLENKWHVFYKQNKDCMRVSVWPKRGSPANEYRITKNEWNGMKLVYEYQKNNVNEWDNES